MEFLTNNDIIELNNSVIEKIKGNNSVKRRVKNECNTLYPLYPDVFLNSLNNSTEISVTVSELVNNKFRIYKFVVKENYPFEPPMIYFNNAPYSDLLKMCGEYEKDMVKKLKGQDCLCCHSINCHVNWSPAIRLHRIIDEIKETLKFKRDIVNLLLASKIKQKYNIPYANIETYLV
jgi:ubiquitin-protein ligase